MTENVLYVKGEEDEDMEENDEWDDSLLVKAYDKAITLAKEKLAAKLAGEKDGDNKENGITENEAESKPQPKNNKNKRPKWKAGMSCRAEYSSDGREYEAVIMEIDHENGVCTVKYLGYGNEEEVEIKSLQPSLGKEAQYAQKLQAAQDNAQNSRNRQVPDYNDTASAFSQEPGVIPPPPPPFVMANLPKDESDAFSAMLMSWYMSGYHTGYYQGLTRAKPSQCHCTFRKD